MKDEHVFILEQYKKDIIELLTEEQNKQIEQMKQYQTDKKQYYKVWLKKSKMTKKLLKIVYDI